MTGFLGERVAQVGGSLGGAHDVCVCCVFVCRHFESVRRFHICKTIRNQHFHPITPPPRRHSLHCTAALHCTPPRFIGGSCALPCHGVHLPIVVRWTPPHLTEAQVVLDDSNTFIPSEQHEINNGIIQSILRHPCRSGGRHAGIPLWERGGVAAAAQSRNLYIAKKV